MKSRLVPILMFAFATFLMIGWYWYSDRFLYQPMTLEDMLKKVEKNPDDPDALYHAGQMYRQLGRSDQAKRPLTRAVQLSPRNAAYRTAFGEALLDTGDAAGAVQEFIAAFKLDSKNPFPLYRAGVAYREAGDYGRAREMLDLALKQIPAPGEGESASPGEAEALEERVVSFQREVLNEVARVEKLRAEKGGALTPTGTAASTAPNKGITAAPTNAEGAR